MESNPSQPPETPSQPAGPSRLARLKAWVGQHKKIAAPVAVVVLLVLLAIIPWSRYTAAGAVMSRDFNMQISDATADFPVSGATITVDNQTATTDANGKAHLRLKVGHHLARITKTYYRDQTVDFLVPLRSQKQPLTTQLTATGRQVKITVQNLINHQPIAGAQLSIDGVKAVSGSDGSSLLVVSPGRPTEQAKVTAAGYNDITSSIEVSASQVKQNTIKLTPAGKVYFLSNLSGKLDVVKANLDGTGRQTVLAGTGREDGNNTVLLASADWHYLALLANRDGAPKLYIINTDSDNLLVMDQTSADFAAVGWQGHRFVYTVARHNYNSWQSNAFSIKSYDADSGKLLTLANTSATGTSLADAQYENFWDIKLFNGDVVFTRTWYQYPGYLTVSGKQNALAAIRPDGTNSRQLKTVDAATSYFGSLRVSQPKQLVFSVASNDGSDVSYFTLDKTGTIKSTDQPKDFYDNPIAYLNSPSGEETFWQESRDGKNSLFVGDSAAADAKPVATLSDFSAYGWFTGQYLLVSKHGSELYILPRSGIASDAEAVKITDYHKPAQNYYGYGGL